MLKILLLGLSLITQLSWGQENAVIKLSTQENVRYLKNDILEIAANLPLGTIIQFPKENVNAYNNYRDSSGSIQRSSTGFFSKVQILSVTPENEGEFSKFKITELNSIANGLFITKSLSQDSDTLGEFKPLSAAVMTSDYLSIFTEQGKARYGYSVYFLKRFGENLNRSVDSDKMSARDRIKWSAVYEELKNAGNREVQTASDYLFVNLASAQKYTSNFETTGETVSKGAWTMAVKSTAVRHGFPNVPCAEFMSEMIRQAYHRAGHDFREDFNLDKGNYLSWDKTAAVVNLANALIKAGWIPWELNKYSPPIGAIMMHEQATSPGHTYMVAGDNGRFIVDNGSPAGRDLRNTSKKTIELMFKGGVYFLPPGIIPNLW